MSCDKQVKGYMQFDDILKHCREYPNGTVDLIPYVDAHKREVTFDWGNSLRLSPLFDKETATLQSIVGKRFSDVHPNRIKELLMMPNVRVAKTRGLR